MLGDRTAIATAAVKNLAAAKKFYEGTLGLKLASDAEQGTLMYKTGSSTLLVYESSFAGTNKATAVTWDVGKDVVTLVKSLKAKGVKFEHYDMPGLRLEGDVHVGGKMRAAWFKDPDGNIHAIIGQE